jgi:sterol desaturase/sphingolipid hydroxylase (fatty acid hydroxylase superfamily)
MSTTEPRPDPPEAHWLSRPATVRRLWQGFAAILIVSVLAQVLVHMHTYFGLDGWFGFNAGFGFLSCVGMVLFAKVLGLLLKRPDDYYDRDSEAKERRDDA